MAHRRFVVAVLLFVLTACRSGDYTDPDPSYQPSTPVKEGTWTVGADVPAPVVRGVIDGGRVYLATEGAIYRVDDGRPVAVSRKPAEEARLQIAPGGGLFAWNIPLTRDRGGAARITLHRLDGDQIAAFETEPAAGPDVLILGLRGNLIVTMAPLEDPEGHRGPFRYTFWNRNGQRLQSVVIDEVGTPVAAVDGSALAILGRLDTRTFSPSGQLLWRIDGQYRAAAISSDGRRAALNPNDRQRFDEIDVVEGGRVVGRLAIPTAVHRLVISPDGNLIAAAGDRGRLFLFEGSAREPREVRAPQADNDTPYIFDLELAGPDAFLLGRLHKRGTQRGNWPAGSIVVVRRDGTVDFRRDFDIREATSSIPGIDVVWGADAFVGYTNDTAIVGRLERR